RITPVGASPDELSHLHYINGIADHLRLPPAGEPERQQPPLYYLLGAIVAKLSGDDPRLIRLVSVVLGVLTVLTVYAVARRLFPLRPALAVGAAALVALLPEAQYLAGAINDDNLAWLAGALLVLAGVVVVQSEVVTPRLALGAGLAVALAVLAKETVWLLALLFLVLVVVRCGRQLRALHAAALLVPTIVLAGWWFVRNAVEFGSPLPPLHPITAQRQVFDSLAQVRGYLAATAVSLVGMYGDGAHLVAISILGARPLPGTVAIASVAIITLAACVAVARSWARWDPVRRRVAILLLGVLLVAAVQSVLNSATFDLQPQARYLLVAVAAAAPITAWTVAWRRTGPLSTTRATAIGVLVALALVLDVSGLITAAHTAV
ncbi:MAG TPA: glycosyltransferase family 39 protein, partial [Thermoanaerobaculia bacterium]|nr:glycosyltransferase family 39 protein [Thermoanaerobaculia bacterium]